MWSNHYIYYEIRADAAYSRSLPTNTVLKVLDNAGVLLKFDRQHFRNEDSYPWISIVAVDSENGNYGKKEQFNSKTVNLIAVAGSKREPKDESFYVVLLTNIAAALNWELILESDHDGNEDIVLWAIS